MKAQPGRQPACLEAPSAACIPPVQLGFHGTDRLVETSVHTKERAPSLIMVTKQNVPLSFFLFSFSSRGQGERQGEAACVSTVVLAFFFRVIMGNSGRALLLCHLSFGSWAGDEPTSSLGTLSASILHTFI